jgi:hypothetical protein
MIADVELKVGMKDKAYLHHMYCKVKDQIQEKSNSYKQIKMCTLMNVVDMVWWILSLEWVLDITIHD